MTHTGHPPFRAQRGFFILIVLVVLAIMSAMVIAQFATTGNNEVMSVRSSDDSKARALAAGCMSMLQAYVDADLAASPPDFDGLLNPDNNPAAIAGTENLPTSLGGGETVVLLPKGLAGTPDFLQRHRWLLVPQPVGATERGACLVRFDDNSDDALPVGQLPAGTVDQAGEGTTTAEVPFLDRDKAIYLTAIGLFPYLTGTAAADAYARAHARVTLRRLFNAGSTGTAGSPAILAGGDVSGIKGTVCGGGITASTFSGVFKGTPFSGSGCGCGPITYNNGVPPPLPSTCTPAQCPGGCTAMSASPPTVPPPIGPVLATLRPPGSFSVPFLGSSLVPYQNENFGPARPPGSPTSNFNLGALDLAGGTVATCKLFYKANGDVYLWDRLDTANGCDTDSGFLGLMRGTCLPGPCGFPISLVATPCWKQVHTGGGVWRPNKGAAIPGVTNAAARWGAPLGAAYQCGDPTPTASCDNCDGATNDAGSFAAGTWTFTNTKNIDLPVPAYIVIEGNTTTTIDSIGGGAPPTMLRASFAARGPITITGNAGLCGASCDCSAVGGATLPAGSCVPTDPTIGILAAQTCSAIRSGGTFTSTGPGSNTSIVGSITAAAVLEQKTQGCFVGNVGSLSGSGSPTCNTSSCGALANLCWEGNSNLVGNMYAQGHLSIEGDPLAIFGTIAASQSVCTDTNGLQINGRVVAGTNVMFKGGPSPLTFNGTSGSAAIAPLRLMMETAW